MIPLVPLGTTPDGRRTTYVLRLSHVDQVPKCLPFPSRRFVLFVAADTVDDSYESLYNFGAAMVTGGLSHFCAWGPGCERLHDVVDDAFLEVGTDPDQEYTLMTTWHHDEPLTDAACFCLEHAVPDGTFADQCECTVFAVIGNEAWADQVEAAVRDCIQS